MTDMYNFIAQALMIAFVLWLIDRILLILFGAKWRMPADYEEEKEKRWNEFEYNKFGRRRFSKKA